MTKTTKEILAKIESLILDVKLDASLRGEGEMVRHQFQPSSAADRAAIAALETVRKFAIGE
jgi:hypothetical protein